MRKAVVNTLTKKASYPASHAIIENTIKHNIAQMTSRSKPRFLVFFLNQMKSYNSMTQA